MSHETEYEERPGFLSRIRPIAAVVFGAYALWAIASIAYSAWRHLSAL